MTIRLTKEKARGIKNTSKLLFKSCKPQAICEIARIIGKIVARFPGVMHGPLYYRELERDKTTALERAKGDFDAPMVISAEAKQELHWWECNVETSFNCLSREEPQHQLTTDASQSGWGAECKGTSTGGTWTKAEAENHIN